MGCIPRTQLIDEFDTAWQYNHEATKRSFQPSIASRANLLLTRVGTKVRLACGKDP